MPQRYEFPWDLFPISIFLKCLRLQDFPRGLGKGSDTAVVGAWLESVLADVDLEQVDVPSPYFFVFYVPILFGERLPIYRNYKTWYAMKGAVA